MIQTYTFEGFYNHKEIEGKLIGEIEIHSEGFFESVTIDCTCKVPEQTIKGRIYNEANSSKLSFFRYPKDKDIARVVYLLEKSKTTDFSGKYIGQWIRLPYTINTNEDIKSAFAEIDPEVCGVQGYTELELHRKM